MKIKHCFTTVVLLFAFVMLCFTVSYALESEAAETSGLGGQTASQITEETEQTETSGSAVTQTDEQASEPAINSPNTYIFTKADEPLLDGTIHQCSYFNDMKGHWSRDNVCFVRENNIMTGVYPDQFRPQNTFSRSMAITVLYRLAGSPAVEVNVVSMDDITTAPAVSIAGFTDIEQNYYYTKPVVWAVENDIVSSSNTDKFNPYNPITREELAILFYNYAEYMGYDVSSGSARSVLDSFGDRENISPWAARAIAYMANIGVMSGNADSDIQPGNAIVRGEVAAMIERFISYEQEQ